jgi:hypothetical protein
VHTRKGVSGEDHPQFKHGRDTKLAKKRHQKTMVKLLLLEDLGHHIKMFHENATRTRGRKPNSYLRLNVEDDSEFTLAIDMIARD